MKKSRVQKDDVQGLNRADVVVFEAPCIPNYSYRGGKSEGCSKGEQPDTLGNPDGTRWHRFPFVEMALCVTATPGLKSPRTLHGASVL
ncbi:MAG: hypothetical protein CMB36_06125 [Euryarchaeota archaeon]|nr:hypothetical protein [Euryarchaeota archaeon]